LQNIFKKNNFDCIMMEKNDDTKLKHFSIATDLKQYRSGLNAI